MMNTEQGMQSGEVVDREIEVVCRWGMRIE